MALCDRLEAQQQGRDTHHAALARASLARFAEAPTPANLDFLFHQSYTITPADLRKSILTLAVQGKLVPQDPDDEPISTSLERIRNKIAAATNSKAVALNPISEIDDNEIPFEVPPCWMWVRLQDTLPQFQNGASSRGDKDGQAVVVLRLADITSRRISLENTREIPIASRDISKYSLRQGDVLITRVNGSADIVGTFIQVDADINAIYCDHFIRMRIEQECVNPSYLALLGDTHLIRDQIGGLFVSTAGQKTVNQGHIGSLLITLPPLPEQRRIVAKVDQLMALVDQLESQLSEAKSRSAALLEAVIHELLNPSAEVIDLASYRAAIGCYTIRKMSPQPYFGRTAAMKTLYLAETHVGLHLGFQPEREAAGPLDHWIYRFEDEGKQKAWFKAVENTSNGKMKVEYQPGKMLAAQAAQAESQLAQKQRKEFDRLLDLLSGKKTEEVEIIATLFAAWNDFLIDGHAPSDDEIVTEVRENWHVKKERFTPTLLRQWLGWLRQNNLVPQGRLPHTVHQSKLSLN